MNRRQNVRSSGNTISFSKSDIILTIILVISIVILAILLLTFFKTMEAYRNSDKYVSSTFEFQKKNEEKVFSIDKITYFSSCDADISTNSNSSFKISNLSQFTDIAIFINPISKEFTAKNTLKKVTLSNINFSLKPSIGTPNLYYKNINDFSKLVVSKDNLIEDSITFDTTSKNKIDYIKPILYNNCANPISLSYVNSNLKKEYTLSDDVSDISHNGSLLKKCGITANSISAKVDFKITITNNLDENYSCDLSLNIPLSTEKSTIYDGTLVLNDKVNYNFIKID